jgi:predicted dehydrogenase
MKLQNGKKIKIAFLGGAINSAVGHAHFSATSLDNNFELIAGCFSRNKELNNITAEQYGVYNNRVYDSLSELLLKEKGNLDAIIILTPTDQHTNHVLECIKSGIPIICEKALATNSMEAEKIKIELEKRNGFLAVIYNYLGYPMLRELKNIINLGIIGRIRHLQIEMPQEGFIRKTANGDPIIPQSWRLQDGIIPTISLDLGVHLHMIIKYLTGEMPLMAVSKSKTLGNFNEVIDNVSCLIEYSNNLSCNMWYSKFALGKRNGLALRVYGEKGSAEWVQENAEYLYLANNQGHKWIVDRGSNEVGICNQPRYTRFKAGHPAGFIEAYANHYFDIADSIGHYLIDSNHHMNVDCFGINESLEGLFLFEAISKSSITGTWENVRK